MTYFAAAAVAAAAAAACRKPLPDQLRAVRAAYLGFGSADMAHVGQLPAASVLSKWLKSTKKAMAAAAAQYSAGGVSARQRSSACLTR
jgi:malic enzyme